MTDNAKSVKKYDATKAEKKWGKNVLEIGFCMIPSLLLQAQRRLGLNPTQLAILLQLADYWWEADNKPRPSKQGLSDRLGICPRQVQRHIAELEKNGLVKRIERIGDNKAKLANYYDLSGLVEKLKKLEPGFKEEKERIKTNRRKLSRQGGLTV